MCNHNETPWTNYSKTYTLALGDELIIRTTTEDDAQGLIDHLKAVDLETKFLGREPDEFNFTVEQEKGFIKSTNASPNSLFLVCEIDGEIIANCSAGIVRNNLRFLHRASMGITVRKSQWRKGIGNILMQHLIDWCKDRGIEQLELEVATENNRAVALYEKFGFEVCGTIKRYLKYGDGTYSDAYFMILDLK